MTVVETLTMYGRLRGIQESEIKNVVKSLMHSLLLDEHAKKQAGELRYLKIGNLIFVKGCCFFFKTMVFRIPIGWHHNSS